MEKTLMRQIRNLINFSLKTFAEKQKPKDIDPLPPVQAWVLHYIYNNPDKDIYQKDIEAEFNIARSTVNKIVTSMERKGIIERQSVSHDARLNKLVITKKAIEQHKRMMEYMEKFDRSLIDGIPSEDIETVKNVLHKIEMNIYKIKNN